MELELLTSYVLLSWMTALWQGRNWLSYVQFVLKSDEQPVSYQVPIGREHRMERSLGPNGRSDLISRIFAAYCITRAHHGYLRGNLGVHQEQILGLFGDIPGRCGGSGAKALLPRSAAINEG